MEKRTFKSSYHLAKQKIWLKKSQKLSYHRSFILSHQEDYHRELKLPSLLNHSLLSLKYIFKNWKVFLPLLAVAIFINTILAGLMSEESFRDIKEAVDGATEEISPGNLNNFAKSGLILLSIISSGGLSPSLSESGQIFVIISFLIIWLVSIYLMRHIISNKLIKFRQALYSAMAPIISTALILFIIFIQAIPIAIVIITYSAAVATDFLSTPFYALVYFLFALSLTTFSLYFISSSFLSLVASSTPGTYPLSAIRIGSELSLSRRIRLIIRFLNMAIFAIIIIVLLTVPVIFLDISLKPALPLIKDIPIVPFFLMTFVCFAFIYVSVYWYLLYRWILKHE